MLSKLVKNDLKKNMRLLLILYVATIVVAGITRGCKELGENIAFFRIMGIFFESVFYSLAANVVVQPFLRNFLNFQRSFYSDEAYLTHTLPVSKNQLITSKYLTTLIELVSAFACVVLSILIVYASPTFELTIKLLLSTLISGGISVWLVMSLFVVLVIVEFFMFISIICFAIVVAYKAREHKILRAFLIAAAMAFVSLVVLAIVMLIVLAIQGVSLSSATLVLSNSAFVSIIVTGIAVYSLISIVFYFLTRREFNKGVNVD